MDEYSVKLTSRVIRDLDGIYGYIAKTLSEPGTALKLVERIERELSSLSSLPNRCPERKTGAYQYLSATAPFSYVQKNRIPFFTLELVSIFISKSFTTILH